MPIPEWTYILTNEHRRCYPRLSPVSTFPSDFVEIMEVTLCSFLDPKSHDPYQLQKHVVYLMTD